MSGEDLFSSGGQWWNQTSQQGESSNDSFSGSGSGSGIEESYIGTI